MKRIEELDVMRAAAIFCVVFGHALCYLHQAPYVCELIYSFHMPVLFSLSGVVAARALGRCDAAARSVPFWREKIVRSARRLLLPYVLMGLLGIPAVLLLSGEIENVPGVWRDYFVTNHGLWYLPACFLLVCSLGIADVVASRWTKTFRRFGWLGAVVSVALVLAVLTFGLYRLTHCDFLRSPLVYGFSFYAGVALSQRMDFFTRTSSRVAAVSFVVWLALALVFASHSHTLVGNLVKPFAGLAALAPLAFAAHGVKRIPLCVAVGKSTLVIYCVEAAIGRLFFTTLAPSHVFLTTILALAFVLIVHLATRLLRGTRAGNF